MCLEERFSEPETFMLTNWLHMRMHGNLEFDHDVIYYDAQKARGKNSATDVISIVSTIVYVSTEPDIHGLVQFTEHKTLFIFCGSVQFKMVSMRSGRHIIMRSTQSLRSFPNVALETVPIGLDLAKPVWVYYTGCDPGSALNFAVNWAAGNQSRVGHVSSAASAKMDRHDYIIPNHIALQYINHCGQGDPTSKARD